MRYISLLRVTQILGYEMTINLMEVCMIGELKKCEEQINATWYARTNAHIAWPVSINY